MKPTNGHTSPLSNWQPRPLSIFPFVSLSLPIPSTLAVAIVCATLFAQSVNAQPTPTPDPSIRELDLQRKQRQQEDINRELEKNRQEKGLRPAPIPAATEPLPESSGPKFLIEKITIDAGEFPELAVNVSDILRSYENRELGNTELFSLIRDVNNQYAERGFSTTTISLVPKNMKQGSVELKVNWGYVEGWLVNGQKPEGAYQKMIAGFAMPGVIAKPLNIHQVDQMVENLGNAAKTARIDIQPSERFGYSLLNLVTEEKPQTVVVRADNSGQGSPSNGRYRFSASTSLSDLLLGNDTLGLNLSSRRYEHSDEKSEYNGGVSYSVPFGYSKVDLRFNHSQYETASTGNYGKYNSGGDSQTYSAKFSQVLSREKSQKLSASVELEHKKSANDIEGAQLQVNSAPFTSLAFGLEHVTELLGGSVYSDASFSQGISAWGAAQAAYKENRQRKHFQKIEFNTAWSRPFNWLNNDFNFSSRIGGQYAKDNLLSAEQLSIGDEYTVRGFRGPALWGDQGIYISNTVTLPIKALGGTVTPLLGLDSGYVRDVAYSEKNGGITGLAVGVSGSWDFGGASVTLGLPLAKDESIRKSSDPTVLYLSTYLNF